MASNKKKTSQRPTASRNTLASRLKARIRDLEAELSDLKKNTVKVDRVYPYPPSEECIRRKLLIGSTVSFPGMVVLRME